MAHIHDITAREIIDSRGRPTVQATVVLSSGLEASAQVPSGASTGSHEALELRDKDDRYGGDGVKKAIKHILKDIRDELLDMDAEDQQKIDETMIALDGTSNKKKLGANAILAVSMACARAGALSAGKPLYRHLADVYGTTLKGAIPRPMMNIINGGRHADNSLSIQEFMIVPSADTFEEQLEFCVMTFRSLKTILHEQGYATGLGDEGGFAPNLEDNNQALQLLMQAIDHAGYRQGIDVSIALDVAASEFMKGGTYEFEGKKLDATELIELYKKWQEHYPIISIEDGLGEDDWANWQIMNRMLKDNMLIVGDDLFVTNKTRLEQGIDMEAANAVLIKLNQIGTVSETIETVQLAQKHNLTPVVSHRSGETTDDFIADLSVAINAPFIKAGAPSRGERVVKYNRLLYIEERLTRS
ncbi:MAG: phosphopyruvate hydratase [Patescibacteria group bacterium]